MLRVGLNPYGLTYSVGLQGLGTDRANPRPVGLDGFMTIASSIGAACLELDSRWLAPLSDAALSGLRDRIHAFEMTPVVSHGLTHAPDETLLAPIRWAHLIGAPILRMHLTPVLEGARATWGERWATMVQHARSTLRAAVPAADAAEVRLAIENHQDFGSEELLSMAQESGDSVGVVLDMGNPFAVAEDPVAFARRVGPRVCHVHIKDYRAQFSDEGYRLVRCAIGDGCVPFGEMVDLLAAQHAQLTASIEPAALEARHIKVFTANWWRGYPPRDGQELASAMGRLRRRQLADDADIRTPWESRAAPAVIMEYEQGQLQRSVEYLRARGWMA
jgi:3-oxoisoapionate decarboxylase